jgi:hypothetical protein
MEFLTILLSSLLGIVSPAGLVVDRIAEDAIRDQLASAERLEVRVDNAPSYQLLQGQIDRVRIAGRGLFPLEGIRIAALDVETDAIAVDPSSLRNGQPTLNQPLQAGIRLVLREKDLNRALQSPAIVERLRSLNIGAFGSPASAQGYEVVSPQIEFLDQNRLRFQAILQRQETEEQLAIALETGLSVQSGRQIQFIAPILSINGAAVPPELVEGFSAGISQQFDLRNFQNSGITARVLQLEVDPEQLQLAVFVRVEPEAIAPRNE